MLVPRVVRVAFPWIERLFPYIHHMLYLCYVAVTGVLGHPTYQKPQAIGLLLLLLFLNLFIYLYLFLAVLGLRFCARAFSSCGERGPLFIAVRGPLTVVASLVAEHRLQTRRLSSCGSRA